MSMNLPPPLHILHSARYCTAQLVVDLLLASHKLLKAADAGRKVQLDEPSPLGLHHVVVDRL